MLSNRNVPQPASLLLAGLFATSMTLALATPARADLDVPMYAELLKEYTQATASTVGTRVDYAGLGADTRWPRLLASLESAKPPPESERAAQLAFWINAYNILAIQTVVANYPVESIRDVGSFFSPVWKREAGKVDGRAITLDHIEHGILRKMGEPRIHAAIVCASTSCPSLAREPFTAESLDAQLDATTQRWLDTKGKGIRIDRENGRVFLSSIFKWFREDFEAHGGVLGFASRYASAQERAWLQSGNPDIEYLDYDWSLNDWPRKR
jgi:hypothetical protein